MPLRRIARLLGLGFAVLVTLDTAVWWWLSGRVLTFYDAWQAGQIAAGHTVTSGSVGRGGWPFWPEALVADVAIASRAVGQHDALTWRTAVLRLTYLPWHPNVFTAEALGRQSLQVGDAAAIPITAGRLAATVPLDQAQPGGVMVEGRAIAALLAHGTLAAERLSLRVQPDTADMAITTLTLPAVIAKGPLPFGGVINAVSLHAHATVPLPAAGSLGAALAAWRRAGGELRLSDIGIHWGPLDAGAVATLTLDAELQPRGSGTMRMTGYQEMVDALQHSGAITHSDATIASAMLGLLSTGEPGKPREVTLPLRWDDGVLSAGAVPLLRVPRVTLP